MKVSRTTQLHAHTLFEYRCRIQPPPHWHSDAYSIGGAICRRNMFYFYDYYSNSLCRIVVYVPHGVWPVGEWAKIGVPPPHAHTSHDHTAQSQFLFIAFALLCTIFHLN